MVYHTQHRVSSYSATCFIVGQVRARKRIREVWVTKLAMHLGLQSKELSNVAVATTSLTPPTHPPTSLPPPPSPSSLPLALPPPNPSIPLGRTPALCCNARRSCQKSWCLRMVRFPKRSKTQHADTLGTYNPTPQHQARNPQPLTLYPKPWAGVAATPRAGPLHGGTPALQRVAGRDLYSHERQHCPGGTPAALPRGGVV